MYVDLIIKDYPTEANKLIAIWKSHINSKNKELEFITFINEKPDDVKNDDRYIGGFDAKAVSYLGEGQELIKMSVENFVYLMVTCGVEIDIVNVRN